MTALPDGVEPGETFVDEDDKLVRTAASYRFYDASLKEVHTTSVPVNDEEALEYFGIVSVWFDDRDQPRYLSRRSFDSGDFKMLPYEYNYMTGEVQELNRS